MLPVAPWPDELLNRMYRHFPEDQCLLHSVFSAFSAAEESPVLSLIHAVKYQNARRLAADLGRQTGLALLHFCQNMDNSMPNSHYGMAYGKIFSDILLLPVPLHPARKRERGYNQSALIGQEIARVLHTQWCDTALIRQAHTRTQTKLNADLRKSNMQDSLFAARPDIVRNRTILLCDDVFTTGSTLNACAAALLQAGAASVHAVTVAAA
jgi:ComF family protein